MGKYTRFDLDKPGSERFQELCNSILFDEFGALVIPYAGPGRDGGIDAKLITPPTSISVLLEHPIRYKKNGQESLWVFQAKHTRKGGSQERQKFIVNALKQEIKKWKSKKGRPTHYCLMTNVLFSDKTRRALEKLGGAFFHHFHCWDEGKISAYVGRNVGLQQAYFPEECTAIQVQKVIRLMEQSNVPVVKRKSASSKKPNIQTAINNLVRAEISFTEANQLLMQELHVEHGKKEWPTDWEKLIVKSTKTGLLNLKSNGKALRAFTEEIRNGNALVSVWHCYLGEEIRRGEEILEIRHHPSKKKDLEEITPKLFDVSPGSNTVHEAVDRHLKDLHAIIITDIKNNRTIEAGDKVREFLKLRRDYYHLKKDYPTAFYPNMRTLGRRPIFGWDFVSMWEKSFEDVVDLTFRGEYPESLRQQLIWVPFHNCMDAIRQKWSGELAKASLDSTWIIIRALMKDHHAEHIEQFEECLEELVTALKREIETSEKEADLEWAKQITDVIANYLSEVGKLILDKKIEFQFNKVINLLIKCTSVDIRRFSPSFTDSEERQNLGRKEKEFQQWVHRKRKNYLFAWLSYEWFLLRRNKKYDLSKVLTVFPYLAIQDIVDEYNFLLKEKKTMHWFEWWFFPTRGGAVWSGRVDHDIREALQLSIILSGNNAKPEYLAHISLFETEHSYKEFLSETLLLYGDLVQNKAEQISITCEELEGIFQSAQSIALGERNRKIRGAKELSEKKLGLVKQEFSEEIKKKDLEGLLYLVQEGLDSKKEKPSHFVGPYILYDKEWFLDNDFIHYSVHGMGRQFAETILQGRHQLLVEKAFELVGKPESVPDLDGLLDSIRKKNDAGILLLTSPLTIPWDYRYKNFSPNPETLTGETHDCIDSYVGNVPVIFSSFVPEGEILLLPARNFCWFITKKVYLPQVSLIDPDSDLASAIKKNQAKTDIQIKVIIDGREPGIMKFDGDIAKIKRYVLPTGE